MSKIEKSAWGSENKRNKLLDYLRFEIQTDSQIQLKMTDRVIVKNVEILWVEVAVSAHDRVKLKKNEKLYKYHISVRDNRKIVKHGNSRTQR